MLRLAAALIAFGCVAVGAEPACSLVPGWTQDGKPRVFTPDNLFEYMDGNAEGYILYNFQEMRGVTCKRGGVTFVIDVSDMGDADFAFGMFSSTRDLRQPPYAVGMGGQIVPRRLILAKGKYYAEIAADPDVDHTEALKAWAAALDKSIEDATEPPAALKWFPTTGLQSLRLVPESVLGLRALRRGYLAQYEFGKGFVAFEESAETASGVMKKLRDRFSETIAAATVGDEAFQANDKYLGRLCIFRIGRHIGGYAVTGAGDPVVLASELAAQVK